MNLAYVNRVIVGGWQLAQGHSAGGDPDGLRVLEAYYGAGFRTFDCADIYTGVEALLGTFIRTHGLGPGDIHIHTKYVPDLSHLATLTPADTEATIDRSRDRLGLDTLDLVQFHWWHLQTGDYLAALDSLAALRRRGKLRAIGLTNFGLAQMRTILGRGIPVASLQVQYSVLDRRAAGGLGPLLQANNIALLAYGSVAGGLLSDRYLGQSAPRGPHDNRSISKYLLIVEEMGGWDALQTVLEVLKTVAAALDTDIATVASAYCLAQPGLRACIIGARNPKHLSEHVRLRAGLALSAEQISAITAVRSQFKPVPGDVYDLEREVDGRHGRIMKYNLGTQ